MLGRQASLVPDDLHALMSESSQARHEMRAALIGHWFPEGHDRVEAVINSRRPPNEYENKLRDDETESDTQPRPDDNARKQSFRRLVLEGIRLQWLRSFYYTGTRSFGRQRRHLVPRQSVVRVHPALGDHEPYLLRPFGWPS